MKLTRFLLTAGLALVLTSCIPLKLDTNLPTVSQSTPTPIVAPTSTPQVESTGDVDKDIQAIDKELESDTDLPALNDADLGL